MCVYVAKYSLPKLHNDQLQFNNCLFLGFCKSVNFANFCAKKVYLCELNILIKSSHSTTTLSCLFTQLSLFDVSVRINEDESQDSNADFQCKQTSMSVVNITVQYVPPFSPSLLDFKVNFNRHQLSKQILFFCRELRGVSKSYRPDEKVLLAELD